MYDNLLKKLTNIFVIRKLNLFHIWTYFYKLLLSIYTRNNILLQKICTNVIINIVSYSYTVLNKSILYVIPHSRLSILVSRKNIMQTYSLAGIRVFYHKLYITFNAGCFEHKRTQFRQHACFIFEKLKAQYKLQHLHQNTSYFRTISFPKLSLNFL